jgi:hypothetical protein
LLALSNTYEPKDGDFSAQLITTAELGLAGILHDSPESDRAIRHLFTELRKFSIFDLCQLLQFKDRSPVSGRR